jgi:hypothetical protein
MDSGRASVLELLRGLSMSRKVLRPLEPRLSLYSTKIEFGSPLGGAKPHFVHTFYKGEHRGIYRGVKQCSGRRFSAGGPLVRPASHATWPGGQVSSLNCLWALDTLSIASAGHVDKMGFWKCANVVARRGGRYSVVAKGSSCFVPHHFLMSYFL